MAKAKLIHDPIFGRVRIELLRRDALATELLGSYTPRAVAEATGMCRSHVHSMGRMLYLDVLYGGSIIRRITECLLEGVPLEEIAAETGESVATIRAQRNRILIQRHGISPI